MKTFGEFTEGKKPGLWDNIHAKRKRIKAGSGEKMRKPGSEGAPTAQDFKNASESIEETKAAPKGFHFTRDGKLKRGDADVDGPGGAKLRSDPLDKQRSKIPPVTEDVVSVNEISDKMKDRYIQKSMGDHQHANAVRKDAESRGDTSLAAKMRDRMKKRNQGMTRAFGEDVSENFMDGKGPGKSGDAARHGLKGKSKAELKKIRSSDTASPRKKQLAHWLLNMHHNEEVNKDVTFSDIKRILLHTEESKATLNNVEPAFKEVWPGDIEAGTNKLLKRYKERTPGQ